MKKTMKIVLAALVLTLSVTAFTGDASAKRCKWVVSGVDADGTIHHICTTRRP